MLVLDEKTDNKERAYNVKIFTKEGMDRVLERNATRENSSID
jgi:hypothetical protein